MAKRYPMKEFGRTTKKPKLDISINKGRPEVFAAAPSTNATTNGAIKRVSSPVKCSPNNFWDDDDDDVILLATQVAEKAACIGNITESDITFSEFAPNVLVSTSTQRPAPSQIPHHDQLAQMFEDDDDDDFAMLAAAALEEKLSQEVAFKKPLLPTTREPERGNIPQTQSVLPPSQVPGIPPPLSQSQSQARRQLASERQIKFLMDRVEALKKENTKLNKDLGDSKGKMESKEGEVALLRDEQRHMKQQIQSLKMEKIFSTEAAKTESKTKIAELSKKVAAKETELQLKSVEYSVLKMCHADSMRGIDESMNVTVTLPDRRKNKKNSMRSLLRMRGLSITPATNTIKAINISPLIFEHSHEHGTTKKQRTLFQLELENMQTVVAQLQLQQQQGRLADQQVNDFIAKTIESACKVFPEFWSYVHSLEFPKNCRVHPYHEYDLRQDLSGEKSRVSLHQSSELFEEERALSLRRYVAVLSVVCRQLPPQMAKALITHRHGEYLLLQIANDGICKLGFSRELCEHFGLLEAFAALLHSLLVNVMGSSGDDVPDQVELLMGLLKNLIFTRPSPWIFREVSVCILECTRSAHALTLMCVNSGGSSFLTDRVRSIYRFSNDSCLLQVYAGLLEIAFPSNTPLRPEHFELLTVICLNHVRFVYHCFAKPPKFIHNLMPSFDDDDDDDDGCAPNDTSMQCDNFSSINGSSSSSTTTTMPMSSSAAASATTESNIKCECYTKLCLSVVTLLFQLLRQWIRTEKLLQTSQVAEISKISVQLLHTIFCDNYLTSLFRDAEETTKHYLCMICKWWSENAELLHFNNIHLNFLRKLKHSHVMPKQLRDEENIDNISVDLSEWRRLTNDVDDDSDKIDAGHLARTVKNLRLIEDASSDDKFFEGLLKGYAFNFQ